MRAIHMTKKRKSFLFGTFLIGFYLLFYLSSFSDKTTNPISTPQPVLVIMERHSNEDRLHKSLPRPKKNISDEMFFNPQFGVLNYHQWNDICGDNIQSLRNHPMFPKVPSSRSYISSLELPIMGKQYGKRIFGYLQLLNSISVTFKLLSSGSSELWLSRNSNPENARIMCYVNNTRKQKQCLETSLVQSKLYYFEILHKHGIGRDYLKLLWKSSKEPGEFKSIPIKYFRSFQNDTMVKDDEVHFESFPRRNIPMHRKNEFRKSTGRSTMFRLPFIAESDTKDLFPTCAYSPSYLLGSSSLDKYESTWRTHYSSIFPSDNSTLYFSELNNIRSFGNDVMDKVIAKEVVNAVTDVIKQKHGRKYDLKNVLNLEQNEDELKGNRFLVELELYDSSANRSVRFSEYVYQKRGEQKLCYPEGFKWNKSATVNVILTAGGNQGKWVNYFIDNMARLYRETQQDNFNVIIVDFHSPHLDVKRALEESELPNFALLENGGKFHKTLAIQQALDFIQDPNQIVFQCDLHINIPSSLIDDIRKHTIQGKATYSPLVARLSCGANVHDPDGFWEINGYGLVSAYKSDWNAFGGMDVFKYKHSWGGEDWDLADRILKAQLELERLKVMNLFHYFHTKKGMWNDS